MGQVDVRGKVLYMPGLWGTALPAGGVSISMIDRDADNSNDTIWTGRTDANGDFSGRTNDWRDSRTVTVGTLQQRVYDATDVMALEAQVTEQVENKRHQLTVPFVPAPLGLPQPPIVLNWGPPGRTRIMINGTRVTTLNQFGSLLTAIFGAGSGAGAGAQVEIVVAGEQAPAAWAMVQSLEPEIRRIGDRIRELTRASRPAGNLGPQVRNTPALAENHFDAAIRSAGQARELALPHNLAETMRRAQREKADARGKLAPAAGDSWESIRQSILALAAKLEPAARQAAQQGVQNCAAMSAILQVVAMIIVAIVGAVASTLTVGIAGTLVVPAIVAAIVLAVVSIVQSLPALLSLIGSLLSSMGFTAASGTFQNASADMQSFLDQNTWLGSFIMIVYVVCAVIMLTAAAPAAGWDWVASQINNGAIRFGFAR